MGAQIRQTKTSSRTEKNNFTNEIEKRSHKSLAKTRASPLDSQVYIGNNFVVRIGDIFRFRKSLISSRNGGIVSMELDQLAMFTSMNLSPGSIRMALTPNAGGSSIKSEVLSFEMLHRCFNAALDKTEMEIEYFPYGGALTDYTCRIFGLKVGVSVTRAMKFRGKFTLEDATVLLYKKLTGVQNSTRNSLDKWYKQVLHVWAPSTKEAKVIVRGFRRLPKYIRGNTVVLVTVGKNSKDIF